MKILLLSFFQQPSIARVHKMSVRLLAFCYFLALGVYHPATAQIVITNSVFPVVGDTLHYVFGNQPGAINQIFTPPGGPQAWDLSGLQPTQAWNQIMKNPATGANQASFPGASILYNPVNSASQAYLRVTVDQVLDMGYFGLDPLGLGLNLLFDRIPDLEQSWAPMDFFAFTPHQSSSNILTAFDAPLAPPILLNLVPTADSFRIRITQQRIASIDAYGTLAIPGGTFDVLRKKQTEYRSTAVDVKVAPLGWIDISTIGGQQLLPLGTDTITTFHFLNDVSKEAIAICTLNTQQNQVTGVQYKMASLPAPNAGPDQILCETTPAQLNATFMAGTPSWSVVSGPSTASSQFSSTSNPQAIFTPAGGHGVYTLRFTVTDGMNVASDDVIITFNQAAIIDAGLDQTVCPNDTLKLHATLSGSATNMVWQLNAAYGNFVSSDTNPNALFLLNANGKSQPFIRFGAMTNDPGGCPSGVDTVTIFINSAGPDQTLCISSGQAQLGAGGTGTWSVLSGPSTSNSQFSNTTAPNAIFTPASGVGTYTLRWTTSNCSDEVQITFSEAAIIDAGPDQFVCREDTIFLHATLSGAATQMVWEKNMAYGNFAGSDTNPNALFLLNANGKTQPFIRFGAMTNDPGGCPSGVDTVTIFIREPIAPTCPPHMMACNDQPAFTLTGGMPAVGSYSGPGVSNNMFNPGAAGLGDHVITYIATDVNSCLGSCTFIITVDNGVPINIISNSAYCADDPGPVIGVDPSFAGIQYQLQNAGGSNLGAPVPGSGGAIYFGSYPNGTYRVVATSAQCTGSATATIQATPTNCHIDAPNFCACDSPTDYYPVTINITAPPGMNWTVKDRIGLYEQLPPNLPLPIGTPMTYIGNNTYELLGARTSMGYWVQLTNGFTDFDIMVGNPSW